MLSGFSVLAAALASCGPAIVSPSRLALDFLDLARHDRRRAGWRIVLGYRVGPAGHGQVAAAWAAFLLTGWLVACCCGQQRRGVGLDWPANAFPARRGSGADTGVDRGRAREQHPLVDLRLLSSVRSGRPPVGLAFGFGMLGSFLLIPQLLECLRDRIGFGQSITTAGLFLLPGAV